MSLPCWSSSRHISSAFTWVAKLVLPAAYYFLTTDASRLEYSESSLFPLTACTHHLFPMKATSLPMRWTH